MSSTKRGALIVVEGVDRSGKSTQCRKLVESLKNHNVVAELMVFPDRTTPTGALISEYLSNKDCKLNDHAIHLLFSANRWENVQKMTELLHKGVTLIVDRYSYSGVAFSTIKNMDIDWCKQPENGLPKPDLVFLLTLAKEEIKNRPGFGDERYEKEAIQQKVAEIFMKFSREEDNWTVINAAETIENVHENMLKIILNKVKEVEEKPLQYLNFHLQKQNGYH